MRTLNSPSSTPSHPLILTVAEVRDEEARLAATLRSGAEGRADDAQDLAAPAPAEGDLAGVAAEIIESVESRLPGRVRDLDVRVEESQFVLSGTSNSYYVKQVAQHVAMLALDARMLGRLINEIEVRSVR